MTSAHHHSSTPRHVVGWLVGGILCLVSALTYLLLLPEISSSMVPYAWFWRVLGALMTLASAFCLAVGLRRSLKNPPKPFFPVRGHTISIVLLSILFGAWALVHEQPRPGQANLQPFMTGIFGLMSFLGVATAVSRLVRSSVGRDLTAALNVVWAGAFPFGTAQFLWWFLRLRHREAEERAA